MDPQCKLGLMDLRFHVDTYYDLQKLRIAIGNRVWQLTSQDKQGAARYVGLTTCFEGLRSLEASLNAQIKSRVVTLPIWTEWLCDVQGIGHILAGGLYSYICGQNHTDACKAKRSKYLKKKKKGAKKRAVRYECKCPWQEIERFPYPSSLLKYFGLDVQNGVAPRKREGVKITWSPKCRTLSWKIGESFVKTKGFYRLLYQQFRINVEAASPDLTKLHRFNRAKRHTVKVFLCHLFDRWYRLRGLEPPKPYSLAVLKHQHELRWRKVSPSELAANKHPGCESHRRRETHADVASQ